MRLSIIHRSFAARKCCGSPEPAIFMTEMFDRISSSVFLGWISYGHIFFTKLDIAGFLWSLLDLHDGRWIFSFWHSTLMMSLLLRILYGGNLDVAERLQGFAREVWEDIVVMHSNEIPDLDILEKRHPDNGRWNCCRLDGISAAIKKYWINTSSLSTIRTLFSSAQEFECSSVSHTPCFLHADPS